MTVSTSKSCCSYNYKSAVKGWTGHAPHWFKLGTSAEILVYLGFDYSLSHQTASSLSKCQIINISRENLGDMASPKAFLEKPYQLNPTCEMIWKSAQFYWTRLTGSLFFFLPLQKDYMELFHLGPVPMAFHYLLQQDQRWSLMGWTIHSSLTGGIQTGMLITQASIKLSKTFLDQSHGEKQETALLTIQKVNNDLRIPPFVKPIWGIKKHIHKLYLDSYSYYFDR